MKGGWEYRKLGDVCEVIGGGTPSKDNEKFYLNGTTPWATVRDMKSDVISDTEFKITEAAVKGSSTNVIPEGNVVIATRVGLGKVCLLAHDTAINQDLKGIIPKSTSVLSVGYLFQWFKNSAQIIIDEGTGATVQGVKLPFVKSLIIPIPPLPEQQRIVTILDETFDGIATAKANAEQNLVNARALFDGHLQSVFTKRGEGWVEKEFDDLIDSNVIGLTKSSREQGEDKSWRYVKMNNITRDNRFNFSNFTSVDASEVELRKFQLEDGDFLFNTRNSYELVGKSCIYEADSGEPVLFNNNIMRIRFIEGIDARFVLLAFSSKTVAEKLNEMKSGTTNVSAIYYKDLKSLTIPVPPFAVQKNIANELNALLNETQRLESIPA